MKIIFVLLFVSFSLHACPDLQGKYGQCRSKNGVLDDGMGMVVKRISIPGVTFFRMNERTFPTNGVETRFGNEIMTARCLGNLVQTRSIVDGVLIDRSQYYKQGTSFVRISRGPRGLDILTCK